MTSNPAETSPTIEDSPDAASEEEWRIAQREIEALMGNVYLAMRDYYQEHKNDYGGDRNVARREFNKELSRLKAEYKEKVEKAFPSYERRNLYLAWRLLDTGHTSMGQAPKVDFPGGYSLRKYYEALIDKYGGFKEAPDATSEEEWESQVDEIASLRHEAFKVLRNSYPTGIAGEDEARDVFMKLIDRHLNKISIESIGRYIVFHRAGGLGSTMDRKGAPKIDFLGKYSMRKFYEDIIRQYGDKNAKQGEKVTAHKTE